MYPPNSFLWKKVYKKMDQQRNNTLVVVIRLKTILMFFVFIFRCIDTLIVNDLNGTY